MNKFTLSPEAEDDLNDIWIYTCTEWGEKQADKYLDKLGVAFQNISDGSILSKPHQNIDSDLESVHCEHHYIFFLKGDAMVIIAIFHEHMDLINRLQDCL